MIGVLSAGIAPGLALLAYFYLKDVNESEPVAVVLKTFVLGALLLWPIMFIQHVLVIEKLNIANWFDAFVASGFLEESFKWFILFFVVYRCVPFNDPFDGIIYGASVSLGFATAENIYYLEANGIQHAIARAFLPVSSHALFGVIMGFYLGMAKWINGKKYWWILLSLFIPVILHGFYDYVLISQEHWVSIIFPFMIFLWWLGLRKVKLARLLSLKTI